MPLFEVVVHGRGLWISLDEELERVRFDVTRVVDAVDAAQAGWQALALVQADRRVRPLPGRAPPDLTVGKVVPAARMPPVQPGFAFYPDPE